VEWRQNLVDVKMETNHLQYRVRFGWLGIWTPDLPHIWKAC